MSMHNRLDSLDELIAESPQDFVNIELSDDACTGFDEEEHAEKRIRFHVPRYMFLQADSTSSIIDEKAMFGFQVAENNSLTYCLSISDLITEQPLVKVTTDLFSMFPTYRVTQFGKEIAKCTMIGGNGMKMGFIYKRRDTLEQTTATGDFLGHHYYIHTPTGIVARVSMDKWARRGCLALELTPGEDILHVIAMTVIIERCVHNERMSLR